MDSAFEKNIDTQALQVVERFAEYILKDKSNKDDIEILNELSSHIEYFSNTLEFNEARNKIFDDFNAKLDSSSNSDFNSNNILEEFDKEINNINEKLLNIEKGEKISNILKLISERSLRLNDDDDDEIVTVAQNVPNIDPITKLPLTDPVKNKNCGHIYEKSSIMQLIQKNSKTKCPMAGCVASDYVRANDLVSDYALKRILSDKLIEDSQKKIKVTE